jgi:predicted ferric reductase
MANNNLQKNELDSLPELINSHGFLSILMAVVIGTGVAVVVMPAVLPGLYDSLMGQNRKVFWYLSRASAIAAYCLLWLSMAMGVMMTSKIARPWVSNANTYHLHQFVGLLGMGFVIFHSLILLGDKYIGFNLLTILLPFSNDNYRPAWVGLGQIGLYLWGIIVLSFYVRKRIGKKTWRAIHYVSFGLYLMGLIHGIMSGTDSGSLWAAGLYCSSGTVLLFLIVYRVLKSVVERLNDKNRSMRNSSI